MTTNMANREDDDANKQKINGLSNHNTDASQELDLDLTLTALLASTLLTPDIENVNDISEIAGEYSSLNNTIDELNRYLDRWEERHEQLRAHIREAIQANEEEDEPDSDILEETSSCGAVEETEKGENESASKEKQSPDDSDKSL